LKSAEFLDLEKFPAVTFESKKVSGAASTPLDARLATQI
jgi:polyisoprenoid-binding protein YceI